MNHHYASKNLYEEKEHCTVMEVRVVWFYGAVFGGYLQWRTQDFFFGGGGGRVQQIQLRTEDREHGDLGAVAPLVRGSGGSCNLVQEI